MSPVLSFSWRSGVQSTMDYFDRHLAVGDYYLAEGEAEAMAEWLGQGATRLGLSGVVRRDDFEAITKNLHPDNGERITARMNGAGYRRTWWDVAISPPKDVSVFAALADESTRKRIHRLHWESTKVAAAEMEKFLGIRLRSGGRDDTKVGNCEAVVAAVLHDTARPVDGVPDPHLHTHLLFANAVFDRDSGRWMALQNEGAVEAQSYAKQVYYNEIVRGLEGMGIQTQTRESQSDFTIAGMNRQLVDAFSRRHFQVEERAERKMAQGMKDREAAEDLAALDGRESKVTLSPAELDRAWRQIAGPEGLAGLADLWLRQPIEELREESQQHLSPALSVEYVKGHSFENVSVVKEHRLLADLLRAGRGFFTLASAKEAIRSHPDFLHNAEGEFTTRQMVAEERALLHQVNGGMGIFEPHQAADHRIADGPRGESWKYTREQRETITGILSSLDFVIGINGVAGAGKTTLLREIEVGVASRGRRLVPLAPSGQATGVLRGEGFAQAETLQQWLVNAKLRTETRGAVIVVDEAGMISVPDMRDLLAKAAEGQNRVILVGDTKQIQSVQRGDAFRLLQRHSSMRTLRVEETRRQKKQEYKEAVTLLRHAVERHDWIRAWNVFDSLGAVEEIEGDSRIEREATLLEKVAGDFKADPERLIVASRWKTIHALNATIREVRASAGELRGVEIPRTVYEPVHLSAQDMRRGAAYETGQHFQFVRSLDGIASKGETVELVGRNKAWLVVRKADGSQVNLHPKLHARDFQVFIPRRIRVQAGDVLLIKQNVGELKNGQRVKLREIHEDRSLTVEADGKLHRLESDFRHFLHGYAVTAHASQGATVESVLVVGDGMTREQFYVAATRGKTGIKVVTSDRPLMEAAVKKSGERAAAIERFSTGKNVEIARNRSLVADYRRRGQAAARQVRKALERVSRRARGKIQEIAPWLRQKLTERKTWQRNKPLRTTTTQQRL